MLHCTVCFGFIYLPSGSAAIFVVAEPAEVFILFVHVSEISFIDLVFFARRG